MCTVAPAGVLVLLCTFGPAAPKLHISGLTDMLGTGKENFRGVIEGSNVRPRKLL